MTDFKIQNLIFHEIGPINLSIATAECVGLTGQSGIGKTLFLRALGDLEPSKGQILLGEAAIDSISAPEWRKQVGLLPAESSWWFDTVGEHFKKVDIADLVAFGFNQKVMEWDISRLSSGERQRLALLRLLANHPRVLLLDEPTANLDEENKLRAEHYLINFLKKNQVIALWVSHDLQQLSRVASRIYNMSAKGLTILGK